MGTPQYVWFLVNPSTPSIAVCPASKSTGGAVKVNYSRGYAEFYSISLVGALRECMTPFDSGKSYMVSGRMTFENTIAVFNLKNALPLNAGEEVALVG